MLPSLALPTPVNHRSDAVSAVFRSEFTAYHCVHCASAVSILEMPTPGSTRVSRSSIPLADFAGIFDRRDLEAALGFADVIRLGFRDSLIQICW